MALYSICGYTVDIEEKPVGSAAESYLCADALDEKADITVRVTDDDIKYVSKLAEENFTDRYFRWVAAGYKLGLMLPKHDAMLIHGATIEVDGHGIIFVAKSGVGKTTHVWIWKKLLGDRMRIINGDKPFVRFIDGVPYAYGTPWAGKEGFNVNTSVKLTDICFIERAEVNVTERITTDKVDSYIGRFMDQTLHPSDPADMMKTLDMTDKLMKDCNLWRIGCTKSGDAARVAYKAIFGTDMPEIENK